VINRHLILQALEGPQSHLSQLNERQGFCMIDYETNQLWGQAGDRSRPHGCWR